MGSSHTSSSGPDWADVAEMTKAFEEQNRVRIEVTVSLVETMGQPDLRFDAKAWSLEGDRRGAKPLAYSSAVCRADRFKTMGGAYSYLLYRLDFAIAENAWQASLGIEAKPPRND